MSERQEYELLSLIKRLAALLQQNIDLWLKPYDLARTQYAVLYNLREAGSIAAGELAARLQVEPATVSVLVDTLETKGLVTRVGRSDDKRRKDVRLTDKGRQLVEKIPPPGPVIEQVLRREVDPSDVHILRAVGQQMIVNLEAELQKQERR